MGEQREYLLKQVNIIGPSYRILVANIRDMAVQGTDREERILLYSTHLRYYQHPTSTQLPQHLTILPQLCDSNFARKQIRGVPM